MAEETGYNGWTNYPTWTVALWINNDQGWQESVHEALRALIADNPDPDDPNTGVTPYDAGQAIRASVEDVLYAGGLSDVSTAPETGLAADLFGWAFDHVDWHELGEAFLRDLEELS